MSYVFINILFIYPSTFKTAISVPLHISVSYCILLFVLWKFITLQYIWIPSATFIALPATDFFLSFLPHCYVSSERPKYLKLHKIQEKTFSGVSFSNGFTMTPPITIGYCFLTTESICNPTSNFQIEPLLSWSVCHLGIWQKSLKF